MSGTDIELGPIDYLVVEWPADKQPNGEGLTLLVDLVDRGLVRVLDLAFVRKEADVSVIKLELSNLDLDGNPELAVFEGASSGLIGEDERLATPRRAASRAVACTANERPRPRARIPRVPTVRSYWIGRLGPAEEARRERRREMVAAAQASAESIVQGDRVWRLVRLPAEFAPPRQEVERVLTGEAVRII